jgi:hypothetical protein
MAKMGEKINYSVAMVTHKQKEGEKMKKNNLKMKEKYRKREF